jgi:hypothetical protein
VRRLAVHRLNQQDDHDDHNQGEQVGPDAQDGFAQPHLEQRSSPA